MDPRLEQALAASASGTIFQEHLNLIKIKVKNEMVFGYKGGLFIASPELISFATIMKEHYPDYVAIDSNFIPVKVDDPDEFLGHVLHQYSKAANLLQHDYYHLNTLRDLRGVIGKITGVNNPDE